MISAGVAHVTEDGKALILHTRGSNDLGGVQPRAVFFVRPTGWSIRYVLDPDGSAVCEVEGVYNRAMGQRLVCGPPSRLCSGSLTQGYASRSCADRAGSRSRRQRCARRCGRERRELGHPAERPNRSAAAERRGALGQFVRENEGVAFVARPVQDVAARLRGC